MTHRSFILLLFAYLAMAKHKTYSPTRGRFKGRRFHSHQAYRNALARAKGYKTDYARRRIRVTINSIKDIEKLPVSARDKRTYALEVLNLMRSEKKNLKQAVRDFNRAHPAERITSDTVLKYAGKALIKKGGRWHAKRYDKLLRLMPFPTKQGSMQIEVRDSRTASNIAKYHSAMGRYLETGDIKELTPFLGKTIIHQRVRYPFITDPEIIERLAEAGEFQFESIYELMDKK